jgi:hypothetical protein
MQETSPPEDGEVSFFVQDKKQIVKPEIRR